MKYKALIFDVDGTLIPNKEEGMPSKKVIEAISKASRIIPVGIATARSYWQVSHILDLIPFSAPCIITGGAQIVDPKTRKTFLEHALSIPDVLKVIEIGQEMGISFIVADRDGVKPFSKETLSTKPLDVYTDAISNKKAEEFMRKTSHISSIETYKTLTWINDETVHVTIASPYASKQHGVLEVANMLDVSHEEIIGVGEGYNDYGLLLSCGLKVAMGNAVSEVKAIADYIAPSVEEDGAADVIEKFVLQQK